MIKKERKTIFYFIGLRVCVSIAKIEKKLLCGIFSISDIKLLVFSLIERMEGENNRSLII